MKKTGIYKTIITLEVLSDTPLNSVDLETIASETDNGGWSKLMNVGQSKELTKKQLEEECLNQGTDVEFFLPEQD